MASQQQQPQLGGPMAQPGLQQPSALQQLSQQQDFDPVHRFKMLIPQLKESLQVSVPTAAVARFRWYRTWFHNCAFVERDEDRIFESGPEHLDWQRHVSWLIRAVWGKGLGGFICFSKWSGLLSFRKSSDASLQRFDKSLEEFYAICDQVELCLVRLNNTVHIFFTFKNTLKWLPGFKDMHQDSHQYLKCKTFRPDKNV